ncbi:MAG: hypothetical protein K1V80_01900 [Muribaculaceae bacterium]
MTSGKDVCKHLNPVCTREGVAVAQGMPGKRAHNVKAFAESRLYRQLISLCFVDGFLRMPLSCVGVLPGMPSLRSCIPRLLYLQTSSTGCHILGKDCD